MSTLLNPGCGDCYKCCVPCQDYSEDWYGIFCNIISINIGYANRVTHTDGSTYYWESNSMASAILALNTNFENLTLYSTVGNIRKYRSAQKLDSSLDMNINVYKHPDYLAAEVDYVAKLVEFDQMYVRLYVTDECGIRHVRAIVHGRIRAIFGVLNPQYWVFDPPNETAPLWTAEHIYSFEEPGEACGTLPLTGDTGTASTFVQSTQLADYPPFLGPTSGIKITAEPNNTSLSCS